MGDKRWARTAVHSWRDEPSSRSPFWKPRQVVCGGGTGKRRWPCERSAGAVLSAACSVRVREGRHAGREGRTDACSVRVRQDAAPSRLSGRLESERSNGRENNNPHEVLSSDCMFCARALVHVRVRVLAHECMRVELQALPHFVAQMKGGGRHTHSAHGDHDSKAYMVGLCRGRDA